MDLSKPEGLFLSVDIDSLYLYLELYGGDADDDADEKRRLIELTYEAGVARFVRFFDELGVPAVFFAVGQDLAVEAAASALSEAVEAGHVAGNHTFSHPYDLIRLPADEAESEIALGHKSIEAVTGIPPTIFRAPGYNMSRREYRTLERAGYRWDSSPLPSYPYLMLKYSVLAYLRARGKRSRSIWGNPLMALGKRAPYRKGSITVLPNATTPYLRLPVIGTALSTAPDPLFNFMLDQMRNEPFISLEFHAVDLMEFQLDALPPALGAQKDLLIPLGRKEDRFRRFIGELLKDHKPSLPT